MSSILKKISAMTLFGAVLLGIVTGCTTSSDVDKTQLSPVANSSGQSMRYYGGPKSPMWPAN